MARPREFDTEVAVEQAMHLFRELGYHATSMPRLTARLGIGTGSLYAAFDSKDGLYARALERYCDGLVAALGQDVRRGPDIRTALYGLLITMAAADTADPEHGCLLVGATTERSADGDTIERVRTTLAAMETVLTAALSVARDRGELRGEHRPEELARFLMTFIQGLRVMGRARAGREFLESAVAGALRALD
ncbi:TetR/AcrR family transcriptional regulator [Streptomyces sp. TLI_105]|uniref:TetR/AcrR family transcriptional regulator n=1 Tax=Streptomyces sp. TLI_105 TaxID=1881019 RepID=UPI000897806F|nr:TetR/AcrR family transcriptional regulator [Streptomyces sp. TLI_105]SEE58210.1 transcriptional regulator, TetR family [Streptomyces sp. TLI_105]